MFQRGVMFWLQVPRSDHRWTRVSTGTSDKRTARAIQEMVGALRARRVWAVLDAVAKHDLTLGEVFDHYRSDPNLTALLASLDAIDLAPLVDDWRGYLAARGIGGAETYVAQVRRLIPAGERFTRAQFTRKGVSEHLAGLSVSGSTRNRHRAALSGFARFLVERDVLEHNVVRDVRAAKAAAPRMRYLERDEAQALVDALPQPYRALEALMLGAGLEWQACIRLTRRDVNLDAGTIHARGSKTAWRNRVVRIVESWAAPIIAAHARALMPSASVFPVRYKHALKAHAAACKAIQLDDYNMHDNRHTFAVQQLRDGLSPTVVARQLGHSNAHLVHTTYGRFVPDERDYRRSEPLVAVVR